MLTCMQQRTTHYKEVVMRFTAFTECCFPSPITQSDHEVGAGGGGGGIIFKISRIARGAPQHRPMPSPGRSTTASTHSPGRSTTASTHSPGRSTTASTHSPGRSTTASTHSPGSQVGQVSSDHFSVLMWAWQLAIFFSLHGQCNPVILGAQYYVPS